MKPYLKQICQYCGGTIGSLEYIDHIPPEYSGVEKMTEVWFHCLYCASYGEPDATLISVITKE